MEISFLDSLYQFVTNYKKFIFWLGSISAFIFIFSLLSIKWLVALIPTDYFVRKRASKFKNTYPYLWIISLIIKNILGYSLVVGGIIPDEDATALKAMGVSKVYTPKDFELNSIMIDIVELADPQRVAAE